MGVEAVIRLFTDGGDTVVEFRCTQARARMQFMSLFHEVAAALVEEGVLSPTAVKGCVRRLSRPSSPKLSVSTVTLGPLHAMVQSPSMDCRREALALLASLCVDATPDTIASMKAEGTLGLLLRTAASVGSDYEARSNCKTAIAALTSVAC